jgi:hypothetical protein
LRGLEWLAQTEVRQNAADYSSSIGKWKRNIQKNSNLANLCQFLLAPGIKYIVSVVAKSLHGETQQQQSTERQRGELREH